MTRSSSKFKPCPKCNGEGIVEYEYTSRMSLSVPYGDYYSQFETCENCKGDGEIEVDESDLLTD